MINTSQIKSSFVRIKQLKLITNVDPPLSAACLNPPLSPDYLFSADIATEIDHQVSVIGFKAEHKDCITGGNRDIQVLTQIRWTIVTSLWKLCIGQVEHRNRTPN